MFNKELFIELTSTSTGKVAPTRINENWFYHQRQSELWTEFLSVTELYSDLPLTQRVKVVHLNKHETRPMCKCCGANPVGFIYERVSECCSRECEKQLGITKPHKEPTGRKYNETGKRAEVIRKRTVERSGYKSEKTLINAIRRFFEVDGMNLRMVCDKLNLGKDAVINIVRENNIKQPEQSDAIRVGVQDLYGVDNVMDVKEHLVKQRVEIRAAYDERGDEIVQKQQQTLLERTGFAHPLQIPEVMERRNETMMERFGVHSISQIPEIAKQIYMAQLNGSGVHPMDLKFTKRSKGEIELENAIKERFPWVDVLTSRRSCLKPTNLEVDLYLPQYNLAIEFDGVYHHSDVFKTPTYHFMKSLLAKSNDIRLMSFWSTDWRNRREQILSMIGDVVGGNDEIDVRDCSVSSITNESAVKFVNANHMRPADESVVDFAVGLFRESELVGVMTFVPNEDIHFLTRYCFKMGVSCEFGLDKMFAHAVNSNDILRCVTATDNRYGFTGELGQIGFSSESGRSAVFDNNFVCVYEDPTIPKSAISILSPTKYPTYNNMSLTVCCDIPDGCSAPSYFYSNKNTNKILTIPQLQKLDTTTPEYELADKLKYVRVWDSGKIRWVWNRK